MTPLFQHRLLNHPFEDPALYVGLQGEKKALLFDLGEISRVPARMLFKVEEVFISHTHIDHFIGFDHLVRLNLARDRTLRLYGPRGLIRNVHGRLQGYTWDLVSSYRFIIEVYEFGIRSMRRRRFICNEQFRADTAERLPFTGTVAARPHYSVSAIHLDHRIPSLAFRLAERFHININKAALLRCGLPVGPWLHTLKSYIWENRPDSTPVTVPAAGDCETRQVALGTLRKDLTTIVPGEVVVYIADCRGTEANYRKIIELAKGADHLYCEACFLERDAAKACERGHLTAHRAGLLARRAGVKALTVYHFSPRYETTPDALAQEAREAFTRG